MRLHITFSKTGPLRYVGHLDLHKIWERTARRAALPLAYTQGFHPTPKIQLASALPLGFSSRCELVDLKLNEDIPLEDLPQRLQEAVPGGLRILEVKQVDDNAAPLQTRITSAEFEVTFHEDAPVDGLEARVDALLQAESLPRIRRGKPYDLRPLIEDLRLRLGTPLKLNMRLTAREGATGRPDEVLDALGFALEDTHVERTKLNFTEA